ncbi:MAG: NYN domain-containing protein [Dehalococcoidia bacterium]
MDKLRAYVFIDSAQLRAGLSAIGADWKTLNLRTLADVALQCCDNRWMNEQIAVGRVFVYDGVLEGEEGENSDVEAWLVRNESQRETIVRRGATLAMDPRNPKRLTQKGVDVQLAVDALSAAQRGVFEVMILVSGDGDFVPVVEAVRAAGPLVCVASMRDKLNPYLERAADRVGWLPNDPDAWKGWHL